jgi:hypothetical protein
MGHRNKSSVPSSSHGVGSPGYLNGRSNGSGRLGQSSPGGATATIERSTTRAGRRLSSLSPHAKLFVAIALVTVWVLIFATAIALVLCGMA